MSPGPDGKLQSPHCPWCSMVKGLVRRAHTVPGQGFSLLYLPRTGFLSPVFAGASTDLVQCDPEEAQGHPARGPGTLPCNHVLTDCKHISVLALHMKVQPARHMDTSFAHYPWTLTQGTHKALHTGVWIFTITHKHT